MTGPATAPRGLTARTVSVASAILLVSAAFVLAKTGRDALYFMGEGLYDLPKAYLGFALLSLPMAVLMLSSMRRLGTRRTRVVTPLVTAGLLVLFHRIAQPGGGTLMTIFFMLVPLLFGVLFSSTWLLAADLFERGTRAQLARAYGIIGASAIAGGLLGALVAKALAMRVPPRALLLLAAFALIASAFVVVAAQQVCPRRSLESPLVIPRRSDVRAVLAGRYSILLLMVGMTASFVGVLVEFQFYLAAATSGNSEQANADFFASFYLLLNAIALLVHLFLIPWIRQRIGVTGSLFVLPGVLCGGTAALLASATLLTRGLLRVAEGGLKSSIHRVSWEQTFLPLTRAQRAVAKILVDGAGARIAEGMAALLVFLWLRNVVGNRGLVGRDTSWVTWLLLAATIVWIALTRVLARNLDDRSEARSADEDSRLDIPLPDS